MKLDEHDQWIVNLTLNNITVNKFVKKTTPILNGVSKNNSWTLVELDWTSGDTRGLDINFSYNETINLFIGDCMDFHDTNHQGQYNSSASTFIINSASSAATGYQLTINSITPMSSYDEYHYLAAQNTIVAKASDIKKGKGAFNTNGEFIIGNYEGVVLPTLTDEGTAADLAAGKQLINSSGEIVTGTATIASEVDTGDFWVKVIDYDGTVLLEKRGNNGDSFNLPSAPSHEGLVFQEWSASCPITDGKVVIDNNNIMAGAIYTTASGQNEFDITLTKATGLAVTLNMDGTKDWGDGTSDTETTHTYTTYGNYTIKCNGTTMTTSSSAGLFGQSNINCYCTAARFATTANINQYAFNNCYSLENITISNNVTSIKYDIFSLCHSLKNIVIPNSVTNIGTNTFEGCHSLINIVIPNRIKSISTDMFNNCYSLTNVAIPNRVTSIDTYAFARCYSLTNIVIPNKITSIKDSAFYNCYSLVNVVIPNSVTSIGNNVFQSCYSLANVIISNSITSIGNNIFSSCYSLKNIIIPNSITNIGTNAFYECYSLTNIVISNSINSIKNGMFNACYSLESVIVPSNVTSIGSNVFRYCFSLIKYDFSQHTSIPTLSSNNFNEINKIAKIIVPDSLYDE